jgi:hypothetical protein
VNCAAAGARYTRDDHAPRHRRRHDGQAVDADAGNELGHRRRIGAHLALERDTRRPARCSKRAKGCAARRETGEAQLARGSDVPLVVVTEEDVRRDQLAADAPKLAQERIGIRDVRQGEVRHERRNRRVLERQRARVRHDVVDPFGAEPRANATEDRLGHIRRDK